VLGVDHWVYVGYGEGARRGGGYVGGASDLDSRGGGEMLLRWYVRSFFISEGCRFKG